MRLKLFGLALLSSTLYSDTQRPPEAPESAGIQMQKLEEIDRDVNVQKSKKAVIEDLIIDKKAEGIGENRIKGPSFVLKNVAITGNTVFNQQKIIDIVKPFVGKVVDSIDLKQISEKVTLLYKKNGYVTSKCIIPAQKVANGNVKFQIIEDKLARVILRGETTYDYDSNIFMRYLADLQGKVINAQELNKQLKILSNLPVTRIEPSLQKTAQGYTNLILNVTEAKERFSVSVNNSGSKYTGEHRITLNGNINNIQGKSDVLSISLTTVKNPKYLTSLTANYVIPFGKSGGRISFGYSHMYYQLNPDEIGSNVAIYEGGSDSISLSYMQPLYWFEKSNLAFNYGFQKQSTTSKIIQNHILGNKGGGFALVDGKDETFVLNAGANFSTPDRLLGNRYMGITSVNFSVKKALDGFWNSMTQEDLNRKQEKFDDNTVGYGITETLDGPIKFGKGLNPGFTKYYYGLSRQQQLPYETIMTMNFNGNYTKDRVPDGYEYGGGDYGYAYSASFARKFWYINSSVSLSQSKVYTQNEDGTTDSVENAPSFSAVLNTEYKDLYISLSYVSAFDTWDSNTNKVRYTISYSW